MTPPDTLAAVSVAGPPVAAASGRRHVRDALPYCVAGGTVDRIEFGTDRTRVTLSVPRRHSAQVEQDVELLVRTAGKFRDPRDEGREVGPDAPHVPHAVDGLYRFTGPGSLLGTAPYARAVHRLDAYFARLAAESDAEEAVAPGTVTMDTLARAGYLASFPQHVMRVSVVRHDLRALAEAAAAGEADEGGASAFEPTALALPPAACLHLFAGLLGRRLDAPLHTSTLLGQCGRHEAGQHENPERLWTYRLREIVTVGEPEPVAESVGRFLALLERAAVELAVPCTLEEATDPFFGDSAADLTSFQVRIRPKTELRPRHPLPTRGALASVNAHGAHFGQAFRIGTAAGTPAFSACVGFGLERWATALLALHGPAPENWPAVLDDGRKVSHE
ncbi:hypothetical protein [Streptomyces sp. R44]|uniref:Aminoacyl-transfer RNA synthetases class-II family profile domain-containing protein n=1 Tax=Streptomyces sp. R44 TaxID=3238633 RepID=A0AB39T9B9_9ACTN